MVQQADSSLVRVRCCWLSYRGFKLVTGCVSDCLARLCHLLQQSVSRNGDMRGRSTADRNEGQSWTGQSQNQQHKEHDGGPLGGKAAVRPVAHCHSKETCSFDAKLIKNLQKSFLCVFASLFDQPSVKNSFKRLIKSVFVPGSSRL